MAVSPRIIKRRIKSIANTRKITKAMELVAASKMRRSVQMALSSRVYSASIAAMVDNVRKLISSKDNELLFGHGHANSTLVVVAASDRGLCGGFNAQVLKKTLELIRNRTESSLKVITIGKRAESTIRRTGTPILASFEAISNAPSFDRSRPVGELISNEFMKNGVDRVFLVYTSYKSAISQTPMVMQLLPIVPEAELPKTEQEESGMEMEDEGQESDTLHEDPGILFEPKPDVLLNELLPRVLETQIYQSLLESSASEHSSRMMAMRSATDNASDMLKDLTLSFNQARQASITREISEISAGKAAIE